MVCTIGMQLLPVSSKIMHTSANTEYEVSLPLVATPIFAFAIASANVAYSGTLAKIVPAPLCRFFQ